MRRPHILKVRLSAAELEQVDSVAERLGLTRSALLRLLVSLAVKEAA